MVKKRKPEIMWCFKFRNGSLMTPNLRYTRKEAISLVEEIFETTWKEVKKHGHSVVKVEVKEVGNG
ncbi:hypothetical protein [Sphingobacterium thalpophilum]|uniref:hypothetical protein n=1 Tax=Sphingobacterium thalpophilum TaxID=259 RepID=UPI003D958BFC